LAGLNLARDDPDQALKCVRQSLLLYKSLSDRKAETEAMQMLIVCHLVKAENVEKEEYRKIKLAEALGTANNLKDMCKDLGDRDGELHAMHWIAIVQIAQGECDLGEQAALELADTWDDMGDVENQGKALETLVTAYLQKEEFLDALDTADDMVTHYRQAGDKLKEGSSMHLMAEINFILQDYASIHRTEKKLLEIFDVANDPWGKGSYLGFLAQVHMAEQVGKKGDESRNINAKASEKASAALAVYREIGDKSGEGHMLLLVAEIAFDKLFKTWNEKQDAVEEEGLLLGVPPEEHEFDQETFKATTNYIHEADEYFEAEEDESGREAVQRLIEIVTDMLNQAHQRTTPPTKTYYPMKDGKYLPSYSVWEKDPVPQKGVAEPDKKTVTFE